VSYDLSLTVEHVKVDASVTWSLPKQLDIVLASIIPSSSPHSSNAFFIKNIYDLLSRLDVVIYVLRRSIDCLLMRTPIKKKYKKVGNGSRTDI
jgi:hypothetical protein